MTNQPPKDKNINPKCPIHGSSFEVTTETSPLKTQIIVPDLSQTITLVCSCQPPKDKEWEKEFGAIFPEQKYEDRSEGTFMMADYHVIKDFIRNLLTQTKAQERDEILEILEDEYEGMDFGEVRQRFREIIEKIHSRQKDE